MMANRVLFGKLPDGVNYGLRVSKPGQEVTNDALPPNAVAFDSRWLDGKRVLLHGFVPIGASTPMTVSYGETLPVVPIVLALITSSSGFWEQAIAATVLFGYSAYTNKNINAYADHMVISGDGIAYLVLRP
jgi:hypothetical protein